VLKSSPVEAEGVRFIGLVGGRPEAMIGPQQVDQAALFSLSDTFRPPTEADRPLCRAGSTDRCNACRELLSLGLIEQGLSRLFRIRFRCSVSASFFRLR
jgi:hypothetical protein